MAQVVKKQYVSKAGEWVEVATGSGGGGGGDFVPLAGGVDVGPGNLGIVGPTLLTHAARWADGLPRFPDKATRDAAYAAIGGAQAGMQSFLTTPMRREVFDGTIWVPGTGEAWVQCHYNPPTFGPFPSGWNAMGFYDLSGPHLDLFTRNGSGHLVFTIPGRYKFEGTWTIGAAGDPGFIVALGTPVAQSANGDIASVTGAGGTVTISGMRDNLITAGYQFQTWLYTNTADTTLHSERTTVRVTYMGAF